MSKYEVFSGPNTGRYGPEKTLYLDTFHAVNNAVVTFLKEIFKGKLFLEVFSPVIRPTSFPVSFNFLPVLPIICEPKLKPIRCIFSVFASFFSIIFFTRSSTRSTNVKEIIIVFNEKYNYHISFNV